MDWKQNQISEDLLEQALLTGTPVDKVLDWVNLETRQRLEKTIQQFPDLLEDLPPLMSIEERLNTWDIPQEYQQMDIEQVLFDLCRNDQDRVRVEQELEEFRKKDLVMVLKAVKYLVDTMKENGIVWGVGRGSSVSSLVLYLLEVHRIDPMRWNLNPNEFFK